MRAVMILLRRTVLFLAVLPLFTLGSSSACADDAEEELELARLGERLAVRLQVIHDGLRRLSAQSPGVLGLLFKHAARGFVVDAAQLVARCGSMRRASPLDQRLVRNGHAHPMPFVVAVPRGGAQRPGAPARTWKCRGVGRGERHGGA